MRERLLTLPFTAEFLTEKIYTFCLEGFFHLLRHPFIPSVPWLTPKESVSAMTNTDLHFALKFSDQFRIVNCVLQQPFKCRGPLRVL